jgi:quercetin dioxygenase-like cupin family protein
MAITHAQPGEVVNVKPLGAALSSTVTKTLFKTPQVEVIRLVMPSGKEIAGHSAPGPIIVQCLEGRIAFTHSDKTVELAAGELIYLEAGEPHSVRGVQDASFLLTILTGN